MIARAGVFDWAKGQLQQLLAWANRASKNGSLQRWANSISKSMIEIGTKLRDFMVSVDWKQFALDIISVASGVASFVRAMGGLKGVLDFAIIAWISIATVKLMLLAPAIASVAAAAFGLKIGRAHV